MNNVEQFKDAIRAAGLIPPDVIEPGRIVRFSTNGKRGDDAGWCCLFDDGCGGAYGDHRSGLSETWQAKRDRRLTTSKLESLRCKVEEDRKTRAANDAEHRAAAARRAADIWAASQPAQSHGYLVRKGVKACGLRQHEGSLVIPLHDIAAKLHSLQFITPDGDKRYLPDGAKTGHYFAIGKPDGVLVVAEGYATAASIHEATGHAVAVAFDAGNLEPVVKALRKNHPDLKMIIAADNDLRPNAPNTGLEAATKAAATVGGTVAVPEMDGAKCDFNDVYVARGADAVRQIIDAAKSISLAQPDGVQLIRAADLVPEKIRWCWDGWLARGKLHILAGAPGTGKTTIALALAATITTGGRWPDGSSFGSPGNVLIWSGEDDPTDTLLPRLLAMGADPNRVFFVGDVLSAGEIHSFDPARDVKALLAKAAEIGDMRCLVVDPLANAVSGDSHKNTDVRRALQPLVDLAAKLDAVVLGISHFSKGSAGRDPVERVTGSIAFGALPRIVLAVAKIEEEGGKQRRVVVRAKSNIGEDGGGFGYDIEQAQVPAIAELFASRVLWGDQITGSARELLANADAANEAGGGAIHDAVDWLREVLSHGTMPQREVQRLAEKQGIAAGTLRHAKDRIGAKSKRRGFGRGAEVFWHLPMLAIDAIDCIDAKPQTLAPMGNLASMEGNGTDEEVF